MQSTKEGGGKQAAGEHTGGITTKYRILVERKRERLLEMSSGRCSLCDLQGSPSHIRARPIEGRGCELRRRKRKNKEEKRKNKKKKKKKKEKSKNKKRKKALMQRKERKARYREPFMDRSHTVQRYSTG